MGTQKVAKTLRSYRKIHKWIGLILALFLILSALTGVLLGWKKNVDLLQPPTQKGVELNMSAYKPVEELAAAALVAVDSLGLTSDNFDRIEYRPTKGIAKVLFDTGSWEVQVDATNLEVLSVAKRHSDWIEHIHDGSIISETFKLISMNILGIGLVFLSITGLWLWYGPRKIRSLKNKA
ncbi:PepSY-associated TM helix domain-containing protein [Roseivirga sp.]|uniref:PepSY-associated TM helix domain-containing protein n=1 Tax=Roseivirga sp. TaxID=1964215 RepID=UPI003B52BC60